MRVRGLQQMHMHIISPRTAKPNPVILYFPGGGFMGANYNKYNEMRHALAMQGFVVASVEYSVVPNTFPAPMIDAKAAVRYLRANASLYNIDPNKVGVLGDSAGGYMAQFMGVANGQKQWDQGQFLEQSSDVQAAVSIYGISNLLNIGEGFDEKIVAVHHSPSVTEALLVHGPAFNLNPGKSIIADEKKALEASPINYVDKSDPPMLLMHGSNDKLVSPIQSAQMYQKLKDTGVDATYILVKDAAHGDIPWYQEDVIKVVSDFFKQKLGTPDISSKDKTLNM